MKPTKSIKNKIKKTIPAVTKKKQPAAKSGAQPRATKPAAAKPVAVVKVPTTAAPSRAVQPAKAAAAKPVVPAPRRALTTEVIAAHAYTLWEKAGRPNGRDVEYWLQAESQLKQETQSFAE